MRFASGSATRRRALAALPALLLSGPPVHRAVASERMAAQSVGIDQPSIGNIVWGAGERCDPTDQSCRQGGETSDSALAVAAPPRKLKTISDRVALYISISGQAAGTIVLGLSRDAAPESVDAFVRLARGAYTTQPGEAPASLERSTCVRLTRDEVVVLGALSDAGGTTKIVPGRTRPVYTPVQPAATTDANDLSHDAAGLLTVRRGGRSFEFGLTAGASPSLDGEGLVIGEVLEPEGMALISRLNALPTDNYKRAPMAKVRIERAQACT